MARRLPVGRRRDYDADSVGLSRFDEWEQHSSGRALHRPTHGRWGTPMGSMFSQPGRRLWWYPRALGPRGEDPEAARSGEFGRSWRPDRGKTMYRTSTSVLPGPLHDIVGQGARTRAWHLRSPAVHFAAGITVFLAEETFSSAGK